MAGKLDAVLADAGKEGSAGFQKIAAGAETATASIEQTAAATEVLRKEQAKLAATPTARTGGTLDVPALAAVPPKAFAPGNTAGIAAFEAARQKLAEKTAAAEVRLDKQVTKEVEAEFAKQLRAAEEEASAEVAAREKALRAIKGLYAADSKNRANLAASQAKDINRVATEQERVARATSDALARNLKTQASAFANIAKLNDKLAATAPQFSPGSASGIAEFQTISDAAKKAAADQIRYNEEVLASARETAREIAAAETAAYAEVTTRARTAAAAQIAANKAVENSLTGKAVSSLSDSIKGIPSDVFGAVTTSVKFATIGVLGLGAALAGIGLVNAARQQAAVVGFTALASQISATTDATTGLTTATAGLTDAQRAVIGQNFENTLINLSNNSALAQTAIQDTSQALLSLGFNGDQAIGIIRDIGNALAASGKTGGGLNDDLKGIVVAFTQIKGAGRLLAQDLNQITTRIPSASRVQVYLELAKSLKLAGANAKEGTPQFNALLTQVQKLAKEGKISSDVAIPAIVKALEQVPGAAKDAATGLDALGRQNLTLTGRFEALKDNIRSALAKAFLAPGAPGAGGKSLSASLAEQIGTAIPAITAAIRTAGPALSNFVSSIGAALFKIIPPLFKLISAVFTQISGALNSIDLTGFLDGLSQIGEKGSGANTALSDFGSVLKGVGETLAAFAPVALGVGKGLAGIAGALVTLQHILAPILGPFASLFKDIARSGFGQGLAAVATILIASRIGVSLLAKALTAIAGAAYRATINMKVFGDASALAGNQAAIAAGKIEAGTLAGGGAATKGFGATRFGKVLSGASARATIAIPLILTAIESVKALNATLDDAFNGTANGIAAAQKHADDLAPTFAILTQNIDQLNIPLSDLSKILDDVGLKTLADQFTTGQFTDTVSGLINALESQGLSAADVVKKLESLGIKTKDAQDAVKGFQTGIDAANTDLNNLSTNQATSQFRAFALEARLGALNLSGLQDHLKGTSDEALATIGTIGRLGDILASLPTEKRIDVLVTIDTINNEIFKQTGSVPEGGAADAATITKSLEKQFGVNSPEALAAEIKREAAASKAADAAKNATSSIGSAAGSGAQSAASKLADKIKSAKQTITESLTAFKSDVTTQTAKQIRSTLTALRKQFDALGKLEGVNTGGLDKLLAKDSAALQKFSTDLAASTKKLAAATARFTEVQSSIKDFASVSSIDLASIGLAATDATTKLADLSKLRIIKPGQDTLNVITGGTAVDLAKGAQRFSDALAARLKQITDFQANVDRLIKSGLNKTTIDQIISAGPANGGVLAQSLAGASKQTIDAINATQAGIDKAATQLGNTAADSLFRAGKNVVAGLIQGLKDQDKAIVASMKHIADVLVAEIKARLKLRSPSRVMHAIGQMVGAGLHLGMTSKVDDIAGAAKDMAAAAVPIIAPLSMPNLARMAQVEAQAQINVALPDLARQDGAWTRADIARLHRGIENVPGAQTTYNVPVTQHVAGPAVDPHATTKMLARAIRSIR